MADRGPGEADGLGDPEETSRRIETDPTHPPTAAGLTVSDIEVRDATNEGVNGAGALGDQVRHIFVHRAVLLTSIVLDALILLGWAGAAALTNWVVKVVNAPFPVVIASYLGELVTLVVVLAYLAEDALAAIAQVREGVKRMRRK